MCTQNKENEKKICYVTFPVDHWSFIADGLTAIKEKYYSLHADDVMRIQSETTDASKIIEIQATGENLLKARKAEEILRKLAKSSKCW